MKWIDDYYCFVCGKNNPDGLKLDFTVKDNKIYTEYTFPKKFQGYADIVHGGMIGLILDEVMVMLPYKLYSAKVISAEFDIKLKNPVKVAEKVIFTAEIDRERKSLIYMKSQATLENGEVVATATSTCLKVPD